MWKRLTERLDERRQVLLSAGLVGALLVFAALFPLLFRVPVARQSETDSAFGTAAQCDLFLDYWEHGIEAEGQVVPILPDGEMERFCRARMEMLVNRWVDDRAFTYSNPTGQSYTALNGTEGSLLLCRMWLQARGDWQNWVDACFNAETGQIYYLYVSRECLTDAETYGGERPDAEAVARAVAEESGLSLRRFRGDGTAGDALLETQNGSLVCYDVRGVWYDALIDIRVICV
ncbi:MAG: hypothetical protein K5990_00550 [Oscillospiraceae bacterium]|nr:hypothetical protein [Oscillospiraceae bacterium]